MQTQEYDVDVINRLYAVNAELVEALGAMVAAVDRAKGNPVTFHEGMKECSVTKARAAIAKAKP